MTEQEAEVPNVGVATCKDDGTIQLMLRAEGPGGILGETLAVYDKDHPKYASIAQHLGGIQPGESKPIPPFD